MTPVEQVVLLDDSGREIGTAPKANMHGANAPLHRAFSCYLFAPDDRLLLTRRASTKPTSPGFWTNSVCGHPGRGEDDLSAISRRARLEVGLATTDPHPAIPDFRYRAESGGILENEICPVYLARTTDDPDPAPGEVDDWTWCSWTEFLARLATDPDGFSPWCRAQAARLNTDHSVEAYLDRGRAGASSARLVTNYVTAAER